MSSELELLKQRITELEAENAKLRKENTEIRDLRIKLSVSDAEIVELKRRNAETLRSNAEYNERRDAENTKLRARIEEMESELGDKITKVEEKQTLQSTLTANDNSSNNSSPSVNSVAVPEAITVPTNSAKRLNGKSLEEKDMDSFLLEAHKKIVSSEIKQCNKEKKFLREYQVHSKLTCDKKTVTNGNDQDSKLSCDKKTVTNGNDQDLKLSLSTGDNISAPSSIEDNLSCDMKMITCTDSEDAPSDEMSGPIATQPLDRNQATEQTLKHELSRPISSVGSVKLQDRKT